MDRIAIATFQETVWGYYAKHARNRMPWRQSERDGSFDPYKIMVSEIMLQQTQVARVVVKYHEFITRFPSLKALAGAELADVLRVWQGLGYNRRAKFIWQAAKAVVDTYEGNLPQDIGELVKLPGVGKNTAGAIIAYSWNQPVVYIETNIRTVFIYHFLQDREMISDSTISDLVAQTLPIDTEQTREWYWALMDYGQYIKQIHGNLNKLSKSYAKQTTFEGSRRQVRGAVLRCLTAQSMTLQDLRTRIVDLRLESVLQDLRKEQIITVNGDKYQL